MYNLKLRTCLFLEFSISYFQNPVDWLWITKTAENETSKSKTTDRRGLLHVRMQRHTYTTHDLEDVALSEIHESQKDEHRDSTALRPLEESNPQRWKAGWRSMGLGEGRRGSCSTGTESQV